jgi:citrate synthase
MSEEVAYARGLEGVIAAESIICKIDGQQGKLYYRGYSIEELAEYSDFEEVTYLLLYGKLPTPEEFSHFSQCMRGGRALAPPVVEMVRFFPKAAHPMESSPGGPDPDGHRRVAAGPGGEEVR